MLFSPITGVRNIALTPTLNIGAMGGRGDPHHLAATVVKIKRNDGFGVLKTFRGRASKLP